MSVGWRIWAGKDMARRWATRGVGDLIGPFAVIIEML